MAPPVVQNEERGVKAAVGWPQKAEKVATHHCQYNSLESQAGAESKR